MPFKAIAVDGVLYPSTHVCSFCEPFVKGWLAVLCGRIIALFSSFSQKSNSLLAANTPSRPLVTCDDLKNIKLKPSTRVLTRSQSKVSAIGVVPQQRKL